MKGQVSVNWKIVRSLQ